MADLRDFAVRPTISSVLAEVANPSLKRDARVAILQKNDHPALRVFLAIALHPLIKWDIPEDDPKYEPAPSSAEFDLEGVLYNQMRKMYMFLKPNHIFLEVAPPGLTPERKLHLFIQLLESVSPEDAKLLLAAKRKKLPVKVSKETIEAAFPGLLTFKPEAQ